MDPTTAKQEPPKWVVDHLTTVGGTNQFRQPNYRVVWGGNRTYQVGGKFKKVLYVDASAPIIGECNQRAVVTEVDEIRTLLKYHPYRWHLERWRGPEWYGTREEWYQNTWDEDAQLHTMGDYPSQGDYEHVFFLAQCPHMKEGDTEWCMLCQASMGEYIPLEDNVHLLDLQIHMLRLSEDVHASEERAALFMRESDKRQVRRKIAEDRIRNALRPQLALQPTNWQPGTGGKCSVPEPKIRRPLSGVPLGFSQSVDVMPQSKQNNLKEK